MICSCSLTLSTQPTGAIISIIFLPEEKGCLDIDPSDILTRVQPSIATATGRAYTLSKKEVQDATAALEVYLCV
jgi:hypothetical protein